MGRLLLDLGYATEVQICEVVAEQLHIPAADLVAVDIPNEVLDLVTRELATKYVCLPWFVDGRDLYLIMADPTNVAAADADRLQHRAQGQAGGGPGVRDPARPPALLLGRGGVAGPVREHRPGRAALGRDRERTDDAAATRTSRRPRRAYPS